MTTRNQYMYILAKEAKAQLDFPYCRTNEITILREKLEALAAAVLREHAPPEPRKWEGWGCMILNQSREPFEVWSLPSKEDAIAHLNSGRVLARITATEMMETE